MANKNARIRNREKRQRRRVFLPNLAQSSSESMPPINNLTAPRTNLIPVNPMQFSTGFQGFQRFPSGCTTGPRNPAVFHFEARSANVPAARYCYQGNARFNFPRPANMPPFRRRYPVPRFGNEGILRPAILNLQSSSTVSRSNYGIAKEDREVEVTSSGVMKIQVASTENNDTDNEVEYLYTVDTNAGLVELVDLSEESKSENNKCENRNLTSSRLCPSNTKITSTVAKESSATIQTFPNGASIPCITLDVPKTLDPVLKKNTRKRGGEAYCTVCDTSYEKACNSGAELFSSRCGHLFCRPCLGILNPYKCSMCNREISNVWKIYL